MELDQYIDRFKKDYQFRLDFRTLQSYEFSVRLFYQMIEKPLKDVSKRDIRAWLNELSEMEYKQNTIKSKLIGLKAFFKYCYEERVITSNPAKDIQLRMSEDQIPRYLTKEQLNQLRKIVNGKLLERAMIEVLYSTGVRISELVAMKKEDINWQERSIRIPNSKKKKGRIVLFNRECAEHLKAYLDSRNDNLLLYLSMRS